MGPRESPNPYTYLKDVNLGVNSLPEFKELALGTITRVMQLMHVDFLHCADLTAGPTD